MGLGPKTKAECDIEIANQIRRIEYLKASLASKTGNDSATKASKGQLRYTIAQEKGELAKLKALRKTLK